VEKRPILYAEDAARGHTTRNIRYALAADMAGRNEREAILGRTSEFIRLFIYSLYIK
jgi:hypothetical protein